MPLSMCHFHADEAPSGVLQEDGAYAYRCDRSDGHPSGGPWSWLEVPPPKGADGLGGLAEELGLAVELPAAVASCGGGWVEYGLVERAYALAQPKDFARLVEQYGHRGHGQPVGYSASKYLAGTLGTLAKQGAVAYADGPATAPWTWLQRVSWWAPSAQPPAFSPEGSCAAANVDFSYLPGGQAYGSRSSTSSAWVASRSTS